VLIVVAVIVGLGIFAVAGFSYFVYHVAKSSHVRQEGNNVKVDTPFGSIESSQDPEKISKDLGIDIYPGAEMQKNGAVDSTFGKMHTVTAMFETSDSADQVCGFYKSRVPNAALVNTQSANCNFVSNDQKNMITINVQSVGGTTKVQITTITKKSSN